MKKLIRYIIEATTEALSRFAEFIKNNLYNFAALINLALPFGMFYAGRLTSISLATVLIVPFIMFGVTYYLRTIADKYGKGNTVPVPNERYTIVHEDGEVSIRNDQIQEIILYLANVEDWLEKKNLL